MEPNLIVCVCGAYVCRCGVPCVMDTPKAVKHPHLLYWTGTFPHLCTYLPLHWVTNLIYSMCVYDFMGRNCVKMDSNLVRDAVLMHGELVQCMSTDSCVFPLIDIAGL